MGKKQEANKNQFNKSHKTLREKLRKKRQELKQHKKEKNEKHRQYDSIERKKQFFAQRHKEKKQKRQQNGIKQYKLKKHIEKFVDIYEDDIDDFYDLFDTLDQGGSIDITDIENPKMQKCLKKMFKYLPLKKKKLEYQKKQGAQLKMKTYMTQLVTKSIQNYLQFGTDQQSENKSDQQSSDNENMQKESKKVKHQHKLSEPKNQKEQQNIEDQKRKKSEIQNKTLRQYQKMKLYANVQEPKNTSPIGPFISPQQRQLLNQMFSQQIESNLQNQNEVLQQENQFDKIFSMSSHSKRRNSERPPNIDDIPQELLAEGSAKIGQKVEIDQNEIEQYDKIYRPKKLIDQHQELRKLGKFKQPQEKKKRVPFDRQRDIVNGRSRQFMNNGVFFDFKDRMTKPKGTNNFL